MHKTEFYVSEQYLHKQHSKDVIEVVIIITTATLVTVKSA